jgi:toxin ParE1/3/4
MTDLVTQRPRARLDLLEQFVYLAENAGVEVAERYFTAVDETCARLVAQPHSGTSYDSGMENLAGLRRVLVKDFDNYLLFYMPRAGGIEIIRVLHGARDIAIIFGTEEG